MLIIIPDARYLASALRTIIANADRELVLENQFNDAWIMEFINAQLIKAGFAPYQKERVVLRQVKRLIEIEYDLKPKFYQICKSRGISTQQAARALGYKNSGSLLKTQCPKALRYFVRSSTVLLASNVA